MSLKPLCSIILLFFQELLIVLPLSTFRFLQNLNTKQKCNSLTFLLFAFLYNMDFYSRCIEMGSFFGGSRGMLYCCNIASSKKFTRNLHITYKQRKIYTIYQIISQCITQCKLFLQTLYHKLLFLCILRWLYKLLNQDFFISFNSIQTIIRG